MGKGVASGLRDLDGILYIQTDVSVNRGSNGRPLVGTSGQVVAIVSCKAVEPGFEGLALGVRTVILGQRVGIEWPSRRFGHARIPNIKT